MSITLSYWHFFVQLNQYILIYKKKNINYMNKIEEIFRAWRIALTVDKDDPRYELASKRIGICECCVHKETIAISDFDLFTRCNVCGCALKGKIFTEKTYLDQSGSCPKEFWKNVEQEWLEKYSEK